MKIGFIGLGMMGRGMAANLQKAGHALVVHDLTRQAASHHLEKGATWASSPRAVAEACDLVFTSLPTPADVEEVGLARKVSPPASALARPGLTFPPTPSTSCGGCTPPSPPRGRLSRCAGERRRGRRHERPAGDLGRRR